MNKLSKTVFLLSLCFSYGIAFATSGCAGDEIPKNCRTLPSGDQACSCGS